MKDNDTTIEVKPTSQAFMREDTAVVGADFFKVLLDCDTEMATLIFFQKRVKPKKTQRGLEFDSIAEEGFLEVKVPFTTFFATIIYAYRQLEKVQEANKQKKRPLFFGPSKVENK
jgi:hypothetical protein